MVESKLIPKGYKQTEIGIIPNDWEVVPFEAIADKHKKWSITGGPFGSNLKVSDYTNEGVQIVQLQNIGDGVFYDDYKIFTSQEKANQLISCNIFPNEIIVSKMGDPVARACFIPNKAKRYLMASDGIRLVVNEKEFSKKFIHDYINSKFFRLRAFDVSSGSTRLRIGLPVLKSLLVVKPPLKEQKAIASIFNDTDELISKLEKLIAKKRAIKQGAMHELLNPKKRWVEKTLGDVGDVKMCRRVFNHETQVNGKIPFFKIGTFGKEPDAYISEELYNSYRKRFSFPKKGDILISAAGTIGRTLIYNGQPAYFQDSNIVWIDNNESLISNSFLFYILNVIKYNTEGGTIQRLYNSILKNAIFLCPPSKMEQNRIVEILSDMDCEIDSLEKKLEKLQNLKQGMIQNLLTGKIRLI
jgi:type I restriction enzyme, S subunit